MKLNYIKDVFDYFFIKNKLIGFVMVLPLILLLILIV